jgi:monoamine oxidase
MNVSVCVAGAGFAGLVATRNLSRAGRSVVLLEARDRVGGRTLSQHVDDVPVELGGTWIGGGQDRVYMLASEYGKTTHPTFEAGDKLFVDGLKVRRYRRSVSEVAEGAAEMGEAMRTLDEMATALPQDAPWDAPLATEWDRMSTSEWLGALDIHPAAVEQLESWLMTLFTAELCEVSLLNTLFLIRSAGNLRTLLATQGGYQQDHVDTGTHSIAVAIADELGDVVRRGVRVTGVAQTSHGVRVMADGVTVTCKRAVIAIPLPVAGNLSYDPPLPLERAFLQQRALGGSVCKVVTVYETPFWREDGLSGESFSFNQDIVLTMDTSPADGRMGVLMSFIIGPAANRFGGLAPEERRRVVLEALAVRFGPLASEPVEVHERDWGREEFSRGAYMAHYPPGTLTQYGRALSAPCGRLHWAGSETSPISMGTIDGAIRSGERVAQEVLDALETERSAA